MRTKSVNTAVGLALLLVAVRLSGADVPVLDSLVTNSPFGKAPAVAGSGSAEGGPLELRGVFIDKGEPFFSLMDTATRRSMWVGLKEPGNPFVVQAYDASQGTVTVEYQGRTVSVGLKSARVMALPVGPVVAPAANPANANPGTPAVAAAPTSDEANRLAQVAEEIRRRRAIRAQAMQQNAPPPGGTRP